MCAVAYEEAVDSRLILFIRWRDGIPSFGCVFHWAEYSGCSSKWMCFLCLQMEKPVSGI